MKKFGSRAQVMHNRALMTSGGLTKKDLTYNNKNCIVSKRASNRAKKDMRLQKAGFITTKGEFKLFNKQNGGAIEGYLKYVQANLVGYVRNSDGRMTQQEITMTKDIERIKKKFRKKSTEEKKKANYINNKR